MKILALDIGTGTQDILLFDSSKTIENCIKMVMPAPTVIAAQRIREATRTRSAVAITGVNMGGGPVTEAATQHVQAGLPVYATVEAATTFDDDMEMVKGMGVTLVSSDEIKGLADASRVTLKDLDMDMVCQALAAFGVAPDWDALAVAVFDHGNAPPGYSDRKFRFDHLRRQMTRGRRDITAFCYLRHEVPEYMTRMLAVAQGVDPGTPILLMDTAEAAVLGALEDRMVAAQVDKVVANLGNEHTLAFHLHGSTIHGLFEHHTHVLTRERLESYLKRLVAGDLDNDEIWRGQGHGAIVLERGQSLGFLSVTGPMRSLLEGSSLSPYFATPHGDMMLAGSFGLVRAWAEKNDSWRDEIMHALGSREGGAFDGGHAH
ncbi:MAG: pyruvate formate lyase-activating protein [Chloroflexi bacterium]|nr:pyruvate formate lyase-activating protein [Chloroflexota bacterium]